MPKPNPMGWKSCSKGEGTGGPGISGSWRRGPDGAAPRLTPVRARAPEGAMRLRARVFRGAFDAGDLFGTLADESHCEVEIRIGLFRRHGR